MGGKAVGGDGVQGAVVVVIEKFQAPAGHPARGHADAAGHGDGIESFVVIVLVQRENFLVDVGDEQVHEAIFVEVGGIHTHAGSRAAIFAVGDVGSQTNFLEMSNAIHKKKIRHGVVGHKKIHAAIVVYIRGDHAPGFPKMCRDTCFLAHVGEG